jgi:hypothetical protein
MKELLQVAQAAVNLQLASLALGSGSGWVLLKEGIHQLVHLQVCNQKHYKQR